MGNGISGLTGNGTNINDVKNSPDVTLNNLFTKQKKSPSGWSIENGTSVP